MTTPNNLLEIFFFCTSLDLWISWYRIPIPKSKSGNNNDSSTLKADTTTLSFGARHSFELSSKERSYWVVWGISPNYQAKIELLLHNGAKEEYA